MSEASIAVTCTLHNCTCCNNSLNPPFLLPFQQLLLAPRLLSLHSLPLIIPVHSLLLPSKTAPHLNINQLFFLPSPQPPLPLPLLLTTPSYTPALSLTSTLTVLDFPNHLLPPIHLPYTSFNPSVIPYFLPSPYTITYVFIFPSPYPYPPLYPTPYHSP